MDADLDREFSDFVAARSHALFRTALALTGHRQQAEDLLQTVLTKGARHWGRIRTGNPEALVLRYFEDRPDGEIAEILGCTQSTVRSQAARALTRLRELCPRLDILTTKEAADR
ncbi:sigma factor-like helix-turn-helix DNA-binding protein [Micromonospora sp. NPDC049175]|uniref:sigma factor-like helix-turn-helix DNA-binding protein n=1 Tax=Micromonospora sp. NPDC049175 TaxID=3364266 RepID=UPI00371FA295